MSYQDLGLAELYARRESGSLKEGLVCTLQGYIAFNDLGLAVLSNEEHSLWLRAKHFSFPGTIHDGLDRARKKEKLCLVKGKITNVNMPRLELTIHELMIKSAGGLVLYDGLRGELSLDKSEEVLL